MKKILDEIKRYLGYCERGKVLSLNSIRAYKVDMRQFIDFLDCKFCNIKNVNEIDKNILREYIEYLSIKYAVKTCKRKIACLKAFFNHLEFEDIIIVNPFRKIKICLKEPQRLPKTLRLSEIHEVLVNLYLSYKKARTFKTKYKLIKSIVLIEIMFTAGLRVGEVCNLTIDAIDFEQGAIKVVGKGGKERLIYIGSHDVLRILQEYITMRSTLSSTNELFVGWSGNRISESSIRLLVRNLAKRFLNGKRVTPHMFRHTFATLLLEEGIDIKYIQELLGHSSITTTQIYLHISNAAIKAALISKHPRQKLVLPQVC